MAINIRSFLSRDITYSVSDQVLVSGVNFAVGILAARALGVSDFGLFALILLIASFLGNLEGHVLLIPMMTLSGARKKRSKSYFATILLLGLGSAAISAVALGLFVMGLFLVRGGAAGLELVMAAGFAAFSLNILVTMRRVLFATGQFKQAVTLDLLRVGIMGVCICGLAATDYPVSVATALGVLAGSAAVAVMPFVRPELAARVPRRLPAKVLHRHWPLSSWLLLMLLVAIGQEQALWIFAGIEFGDEAIGGLRAGQYLLGTTHLLIYALENFMPRTAAQEMRRDDVTGLIKYLAGQTLFVGLASFSVILPIAIFAEQLLDVFFGPGFGAYADHTRIFALVYGVTIVRMIWLYYLRVVERSRDIFLSYALSSAISLALIVPLTSRFGIYGIPLTMLVAQTVLLLTVGIHIARHALVNGAGRRQRTVTRRGIACQLEAKGSLLQ